MEEVARIVQGLRLTRPTISLEQLLALESPLAEFEAHVPAETGRDWWIYTIDGKMLDGEAMVIRASLPNQAESLAQEGLRDTIRAAKNYNANTGLQAEVEVRALQ